MFISLLTCFLMYGCVDSTTGSSVSWGNFLTCLPAALVAFLVFPMTVKLIFKIPAIVLTDDCLKNNFAGNSIQWVDIADIQLYKGVGRSLPKLTINLKDPYKYFNTPLKKAGYKARQLFSVNDISIIVDFVAGDNEEIFEVIKAYWTRKVEH